MAGAAKGVKKLGGHWACKKSAAKPTPLGSDSASWRQDSSELGRVLIDRLMTNNFFHHDFLRCAFSCGLLLQAHSVRAGFYITWSLQEISVVFAWTGPKGTEVLIKSLHSMQEDANPHFEIFTSQSRFYWINLRQSERINKGCSSPTQSKLFFSLFLSVLFHISHMQS